MLARIGHFEATDRQISGGGYGAAEIASQTTRSVSYGQYTEEAHGCSEAFTKMYESKGIKIREKPPEHEAAFVSQSVLPGLS